MGRSPGTSNGCGSTTTVGRRRSTTPAHGSTTTPRRGRDATNARGGRLPPATNEQVTLALLAALMRKLQAAQVTTTDERRAEVAAAQEGIAAAEKGAVDMRQQLQNELHDYRRRDDDGHDESTIPVRRVEEKEYYGAWRNLSVRNIWMWITGGKPAVYGLKRAEMQALLADTALASEETTLQLSTFTGFRVAAYMAEGDDARLAADMFLPEQMEIMVKAMLAVAGNGVTSDDGIDRVKILENGLREGLTFRRVHCRKHRGKARLPRNKVLLSTLIDEDFAAARDRQHGLHHNVLSAPGETCPRPAGHRRPRPCTPRRGTP